MGKCAICSKRKMRGCGPFFRVPTKESIRLLWGKRCGIQFREKDFVCADHFSRSDMICGSKRSFLLPKAIPTSLSQCATSSNWTPSDHLNLYRDSYYEQLQSNIGTSDSQATQMLDSEALSQPSPSSTDGTQKLVNECQMLINSYLTATTKMSVKDCQTQTEPIFMESLMVKEIRDLRKEVKNLKVENKELGHKLELASSVLNNFKEIFTEGQMRKMIFPNRTVKWSWKDISNAICLHSSGPMAYTHLYDKGYPLPHVSTLQRWHQRNDLVDGLLTPPNDSHDIDIPEISDEEKTALIPFYSDQK